MTAVEHVYEPPDDNFNRLVRELEKDNPDQDLDSLVGVFFRKVRNRRNLEALFRGVVRERLWNFRHRRARLVSSAVMNGVGQALPADTAPVVELVPRRKQSRRNEIIGLDWHAQWTALLDGDVVVPAFNGHERVETKDGKLALADRDRYIVYLTAQENGIAATRKEETRKAEMCRLAGVEFLEDIPAERARELLREES